MGPSLLFDKSALQRLSVDESVWLDHFFTTIVSPLFFVETLADLSKARKGRTPEQEVTNLASRTPQMNSCAHVFHVTLGVGDLLGERVPMGKPIPPRGELVRDEQGRVGFRVDESDEAKALQRWLAGEFEAVEKEHANRWRSLLAQLDFGARIDQLRDLGILATPCKSLEDARQLAELVVRSRTWPFDMLALVFSLVHVRDEFHQAIRQRFQRLHYPALKDFAPYAAHLVAVDVYFYAAVDAGLIGRERPSNKIDVEYLYYLPFSDVFTSADGLHDKCVQHFLRPDQSYVRGDDLKEALNQVNQFFGIYSEEEREKGLFHFAPTPPAFIDSMVAQLWDKHWPGWRRSPASKSTDFPAEKTRALLHGIGSSEPLRIELPPGAQPDAQFVAVQRRVARKKGQWWQLPKDLPPSGPRKRSASA